MSLAHFWTKSIKISIKDASYLAIGAFPDDLREMYYHDKERQALVAHMQNFFNEQILQGAFFTRCIKM